MLAQRAIELERDSQRASQRHWTAFQMSERRLTRQLAAVCDDWEPYRDDAKRKDALKRFDDYVYQWY